MPNGESRPPWPRLTSAIVFCAVYIAAAQAGHLLSFREQAFATFWPPAGLLLGTLLAAHRSVWPALAVSAALANLIFNLGLHGKPLGLTLAFTAANVVGPAVGAILLRRRWGAHGRPLSSVAGVAAFVVLGVALAPLSGALIGAAALEASGSTPFTSALPIWWAADSLGILVLAPLVLQVLDPRRPGGQGATRPGIQPGPSGLPPAPFVLRGRRLEAMALVAGTSALSYGMFVAPSASPILRAPILIIPMVLAMAVRLTTWGAALGVPIVALAAVIGTAHGSGPLTVLASGVAQRAVMLDVFIAVLALVAHCVAAVIEVRNTAEAELATERDRLHAVIDSMGEGVIVADGAGRLVLQNRRAEELHGRVAEDVGPDSWPDAYGLYQEDGVTRPAPASLPLVRALRGESVDEAILVVKREPVGSEPRMVSASARPIGTGGASGAVVVLRDVTDARRAASERERLITELREALARVKTLTGLLPICAWCGLVRDEFGRWERLESYVVARSEASVTHAICPDCTDRELRKLRPPQPM